jgi:uncharacterized protein
MNIVAAFHAYKFTHFSDTGVEKTKDASKLSTTRKLKALLTGVSNPRSKNKSLPGQPFRTIHLKSNKLIECWLISTKAKTKGTIILFHGYSGDKSKMLDKSDVFLELGYNTLLVDFMGSGGSEGNQTTIGFEEAEEVKTSFDYLKNKGEQTIYLFGTSMGAAAILKAIDDHSLNPAGIIIECPFGTMYQTTAARFKTMHVPAFPMAHLLVFWGGLENGFWAFGHNPSEYAKSVKCPTLLLYGQKDEKVGREEIDEIYKNIRGAKRLKTYPLAGHENYLKKYRKEWTGDVKSFLEQ